MGYQRKDRGGSKQPRIPLALWRDAAGSAAVEYAMVGPLFLALITGILYIALINVAQAGLETAAETSARLVMTGLAQSGSVTNSSNATDVGMTAADFKSAICNGTTITTASGGTVSVPKMLPPFLVCSRLTVNVAPASYSQAALALQYNANGTVKTTYNTNSSTGGQNSVMMVQLIYDWPTFDGLFGLDLANENNGSRRLVATSVFTTESYTCAASQTSC